MYCCINKETVGGRKSNIEALRLLSMLMVLNLHSCWCFDTGAGWQQGLDFFREATSICAVDVFLIISGYFGIKWKFKSFFNLMFQLFFYSFGIYLVLTFLGIIDFSMNGLAQCSKATYGSWAFISGYVVLYFVAPMINAFVDKVGKKELLMYILAFYVAKVLICRAEDYFLYFLLYLIGRFLRKTEVVDKLKLNASRSYWVLTILVFMASYSLYLFTGINTAVKQSEFVVALNYANPLIILQAVFLFVAFARLNFQSSITNWLSSSCLAIFLIHMHPEIKEVGYYAYTKSLYTLSLFEHVGILSVLIFSVFFGSILIDKVRIFLSDLCFNLIKEIASRLSFSFFEKYRGVFTKNYVK